MTTTQLRALGATMATLLAFTAGCSAEVGEAAALGDSEEAIRDAAGNEVITATQDTFLKTSVAESGSLSAADKCRIPSGTKVSLRGPSASGTHVEGRLVSAHGCGGKFGDGAQVFLFKEHFSGWSAAPPSPTPEGSWSWMLARDFGLRDDGFGGGTFGSARSGNAGGHSGVDFLAPVGTELRAVCSASRVFAQSVSGYGNTVILACPLPTSITGGATVWASILYGHLSGFSVSDGASVAKGAAIGRVGKTGNASAAGINAHVHFEIALHASESQARSESHASSDHSASSGSSAAIAAIQRACTTPLGFRTVGGPLSKGRRIDPFVLVTCLAKKPTLERPAASLQADFDAWSEAYSATGFDVDVGR
jgi:murein DD-endopeptidase MepM/ murein hydrolase activator NlpD